MPGPALLTLLTAALALGAGAAQIGGPVTWTWRPRIGGVQHRLRCLPRGAPPAGLRAAGLSLLTAILVGGALAAYAAEPSAPQRLARDVVGVTGSGDQLSLYLKEGDKLRRIKPGEAYDEGWTLKALSPSEAMLEKEGETRRIGLGPNGALADASAGPASTVQVVGWTDEALLARITDSGRWDGVKLRPGLNLEETRRWWTLNSQFEVRIAAYMDEMRERSARAGMPQPQMAIRQDDILDALGPAEAREYIALNNGQSLARAVRTQAIYDQNGPVLLHAADSAQQQTLAAAYGAEAQWTISNRQADGGFDFTLSPPRADLLTALSAADTLKPFAPTLLYSTTGKPPGAIGDPMMPGAPPP